MKDYGKVYSTVKPEAVVIDDYSVWVNSDITEVTVADEEGGHTEYEYSQIQYTKDEYISQMNQKITELSAQNDFLEDCLLEMSELVYE